MRVTLDPDKFGYYTVGDLKTYSKLEAIEWQQRFGHFPEWNFNRSVFDACDWKTEPAIDLWDLYKARARQIRDSYDYVVLFYSGGSDSHNIISAWIDAGLKIDEIASYWNYEASKDKTTVQNSEVDRVVLPDVKLLQDKGIEFNFRLIDTSVMELNSASIEDLVFKMNHNFSPINAMKMLLRREIADYRHIIDSGKKLCFVWGIDKPQIYHDKSGPYLMFLDFFDCCVTPDAQQMYHQGYYDEMFFWTPDMPEIVIKQAQVIKRFLESCNDDRFYQDKPTTFGYNTKINKYLTTDSAKRLIYPKWDLSTFNAGKQSNRFFSARNQWIWDSNLDQKTAFLSAGQHFYDRIGSYWANQPGNIRRGIKCHTSPRYYL
jgi:hypothetical protein